MRSEPRICLREYQTKRKVPFLNIVLSGILGELSKSFHHRLLLTEAAIEIFLENGCTFSEYYLI